MLHIDRQFANILSSRLDKFQKKSEKLYQFRCPICGDSKTKKNKARGFIYERGQALYFKCHNCGGSGSTLANFIKRLDPVLHREYQMEKWKASGDYKEKPLILDPIYTLPVSVTFKTPLSSLESIASLPDGHFAKAYIKNRQIPYRYHTILYFSPDFKEFVNGLLPGNTHDLKTKDPRIVIPFYDEQKRLIALQGRALTDTEMRYITIKVDKESPKIYGLERLDFSEAINIVEGPFDSLFVPNCIAGAGADLPINKFDGRRLTFIFDNEKRNPQIILRMEKALEMGHKLVVWPDYIQQKDINEMFLYGLNIERLIGLNTYSGLKGKVKLNDWKRCK